MTYLYKAPRQPKRSAIKSPKWVQPQESFSGMVLGQKASRPEEQSFRAILKLKPIDVQFRVALGAPKGMPGWKELDYLIRDQAFKLHPVQIDGDWVHKTGMQRGKDALEDITVNSALKIYNATPVVRVRITQTQTQAEVDLKFKRLEANGWIPAEGL